MNNKWNRLLAGVLVPLMVILSSVCVHADALTVNSPEVVFDTTTNTVTVSGSHPMGEGSRVSVEVKLGSIKFYMREVAAGKDGNFSVSYKMDVGTEQVEVDGTGVYTVAIGGSGLTSVPKQYQFISKKEGKHIVTAANAATTDLAMQSVISTYSGTLNIDLSPTGEFGSLSGDGQKAVYAALATENNFGTANNIIAKFNSAVAAQTLNEASSAQGELLVNKYKTALGFDMDSDSAFAKITKTDSKNRLYSSMVGGSLSLTDKASVAKVFESAVYTQLFNEITTATRDKFIEYVNTCNTLGYATFILTDYNSTGLNDTDRAGVIDTVIGAAATTPYANLAAIKTAFETAAAQKLAANLADDSSSSGGSSSRNDRGKVTISGGPVVQAPVVEVPSGVQSIFNDLSGSEWAINAVNYLASNNIINGVGNGKFNPRGNVKREEFVKMMMIALNVPSEDTEKRFNDVAENAWYYSYIKDAYALNIVTGVDFDIFGVGRNITREQMCTMLYRAMKYMDINIDDNEKTLTFEDKGQISEYALESVEALYRAGIVNGISDKEFNPKGTATRAMAAQMIYQLLVRGNLS